MSNTDTNTNVYSPTWFATFLAPYAPAQTERELAFLTRQLPLPDYRTVLDLCCGSGRHAIPLAARGYVVTGVDRDESAVAQARRQAGDSVTFVRGDMRELETAAPGTFDAAICMWQSFGYFDSATNMDVLRQMRDRLRPGGRLILDVYHRTFFEEHQEDRRFELGGRAIVERKRMTGHRLTVTLDYGPDLAPDVFDWQLYTPEDLVALAATMGLRPVVVCAEHDEARPATPASARMQLVFARD